MTALTKLQSITLDRLKQNDFEPIKQADITRLLNKMLDKPETAKQVVPPVIKYEKFKFPKKTKKDIEVYVSRKLRNKNDRKMWQELVQSDSSSFPDIDKGKKKEKKSSGKDSELNDLLDSLLSDKQPSQVKQSSFEGQGTRLGGEMQPMKQPLKPSSGKTGKDDLSSLFDTSTKFYIENKKTIDTIKGALSKKKIEDGSWLSEIASLEFPEIKAWQKSIQGTPLAMSDDDKKIFQKILNNDPNIPNDLDSWIVLAKIIANPDSIGQLITTRAEQKLGETKNDLKDWYRKLKGEDPVPSDEQKSLAKIIDERRANLDKQEQRTKELNELKGIQTGPEAETPRTVEDKFKDIKAGIIRSGDFDLIDIQGNTGKIKPADRSLQTSTQILEAPTPEGFKDTTAGYDALKKIRDLFLPDYSQGTDLEKYLRDLKKSNPDAYNRYQEELAKYEMTKKKLRLNKDNKIDYTIHKDVLEDMSMLSRDLLKTAASKKQLTDEEIENLYDISETFDQIADGSLPLTYSELESLQKLYFETLPSETISDNKQRIDEYIQKTNDKLKAEFRGDSDLTLDFSYLSGDTPRPDRDKETDKDTRPDLDKDVTEESKPDKDTEEKEDDKKYRETKEEDESPPSDSNVKEMKGQFNTEPIEGDWSRLRPRLEWGNTDEMFIRKKKEVERANFISEQMSLEEPGWGNKPDNVLYKANLIDEKRRYDRTFRMPPPKQTPDTTLPANFIKLTAPVMVSQIPAVDRPFYTYSRDPYDFQQYYHFQPAIPHTVYTEKEMRKRPSEFPDIADIETHGISLEINAYNYIQNQRFTQR